MDLSELKNRILETQKLLKVDDLKKKLEQLGEEMNAPGFWNNQENAQAISKDFSEIEIEIKIWEDMLEKLNELIELDKLAKSDKDKKEIENELEKLEKEYEAQEFKLLLNNPYDANNAIVSIHAGAGGTEAQDWAEMLLRMVLRFCENQNWQTKILAESRGSETGIKSIIFEVKGRYAYGYLKSEHGTHRLVRISPFDAEKMRHTSFALIEVVPEIDDSIEVKLEDKDLRIDTFNSSGAGGQSVNTAYSAIRIVHIPTGITVSCQNERSQTQNKETALKILKSKLHKLEEEKLAKEKQELRGEYKSAEWGNQIRSYVLHPYKMVKDHRTEYESSEPEKVLDGNLMEFMEAYLRWLKN